MKTLSDLSRQTDEAIAKAEAGGPMYLVSCPTRTVEPTFYNTFRSRADAEAYADEMEALNPDTAFAVTYLKVRLYVRGQLFGSRQALDEAQELIEAYAYSSARRGDQNSDRVQLVFSTGRGQRVLEGADLDPYFDLVGA